MTEKVKENEVLECPNHKDEICILRRLKKIKSSSGLVKSPKSQTDDGLSSCSNFPEVGAKVQTIKVRNTQGFDKS